MRTFWMVVAACIIGTGGATACDDHHGECEIEDWRAVELLGDLMIEGVSTCDSGRVTIRLYEEADGTTDYLGNADGYIDGHTFTALATEVRKPQSLVIKYSIDPSY